MRGALRVAIVILIDKSGGGFARAAPKLAPCRSPQRGVWFQRVGVSLERRGRNGVAPGGLLRYDCA
jgi:hypothetical protein